MNCPEHCSKFGAGVVTFSSIPSCEPRAPPQIKHLCCTCGSLCIVAPKTPRKRQRTLSTVPEEGEQLPKLPALLVDTYNPQNTIDDDDYLSTLKQILEKKVRLLGEKDPFKKRYKLHQYALSRGFENDIISDILKNSEL